MILVGKITTVGASKEEVEMLERKLRDALNLEQSQDGASV